MDSRHGHGVFEHPGKRGLASTSSNSAYDLPPDGKRIAAAAVADQGNTVQDKIVFFLNFAEYLSKIAPGKK